MESSLVLLEEGICYDQCILLAFALLHSVLLQVCLDIQGPEQPSYALLYQSCLTRKVNPFYKVASKITWVCTGRCFVFLTLIKISGPQLK